jgi:signal transduction histidine kinase
VFKGVLAFAKKGEDVAEGAQEEVNASNNVVLPSTLSPQGGLVDKPIDLSSLIAERRVEILERWAERIRWEHADKDLSRGELWDHLPLFFDEVVAALRADEVAEKATSNGASAAAAHGTQRLRVGFDLPEVIREYEILSECILEEVEAVGGNVSIGQLRRVLRLVNAGRTEAVVAYGQRRDGEMTRTHSQHVAFVAHELRTPVMTALMALSQLRQHVRPEDQWAVGMLNRSLTGLRELIDKVLTAERLAGGVPLAREPLDLHALLDQVVTENRLTAEQRKIELTVSAPVTLPFNGDPRLLRSAIDNVLGNAIKFTHEDSTVAIRAVRHEKEVVIEIEDSCGGLPEGNASELFKPFVQRDENRSGFGLGLAIVKQAIEAHGGRVSVRNLAEKGCVFVLELPAR